MVSTFQHRPLAGDARLNHTLETATAATGIGLTVISSAGEGLGIGLDATGVGDVAGVQLNVVSAVGIALTSNGGSSHFLRFFSSTIRQSRDGFCSARRPNRSSALGVSRLLSKPILFSAQYNDLSILTDRG